MRIKILNTAFVCIFMMALIVPLAFVNVYGGIVSEQENRVLAARPPMSYAFQHPRDFIKQFDAWFTDNVGFRGHMITWYRQIDKMVSEGHYEDGQYLILIGQEGHHYFADVNGSLIPKFQGKSFLSDGQLSGMSGGLNRIKAYLDERNIPLIVMFCTDKETIYPEYYPRTIKRGPEPVQLTIITEYVQNHTDIDLFNIMECLVVAKESYPVFDKAGDAAGILSHYNEIGAFFAYQELMKHINAYLPEIKAFTIDDVNITYRDRGIYPNIPDVHLKQDIEYSRLETDVFDNVNLNHPSQGIVFENNDSSLPTILFMRDSYTGTGNYLSRYIPQQFGKTVLIHWNNMAYLDEYIELFKPDIVVFESAERALPGFAETIRATWGSY